MVARGQAANVPKAATGTTVQQGATTPTVKFIGAVDDQWQMFSDDPSDYELGAPIGFGATSVVYAGLYHPPTSSEASNASSTATPLPCAIKVVNLDKLPPQALRLLRRETQLMSLSKHPNLLRVRGSWVTGHNLYIALRLMNAGSAADIMRYAWPSGMEEEVVKSILKQALQGLNYLHINGFIHRDVKAANLLIDDDGTVLLGDLGVAASLCDEEAVPASTLPMNFEASSRHDHSLNAAAPSTKKLGKRKSFVGTPCWMAPELISGKQYDAKADIWSFGITAIELTQGRAPRSRESPARVLLKTVQEEPPPFARESNLHKYSKAFKEFVERCLAKDPAQRPTAAELLETPFLKSAKKNSYLVNSILKDLPPLASRQDRKTLAAQNSHLHTRSSISSWDFTIDLSHLPTTSLTHGPRPHNTSARSSLHINPHHHQHSVHGYPTSPTSTPLIELEENVLADALAAAQLQAKSQRPSGLLSSEKYDDEVQDRSHEHDMDMGEEADVESPESSVFELSSSDSTPPTPSLVPSRLPDGGSSSSAATTPLSCSPADQLLLSGIRNIKRENSSSSPGIDGNSSRSGNSAGAYAKPIPIPFKSSDATGKTMRPRFRQALANTLAGAGQGKGQGRRGSSPGPGRIRPSVTGAALAPLQRIRSTGSSAFGLDSNSSNRKVNGKEGSSGEATPTTPVLPSSKSGRLWRMVGRRGSTDAGVGAGANNEGDGGGGGRPGFTSTGERKKGSTLGRILERSKSGVVNA